MSDARAHELTAMTLDLSNDDRELDPGAQMRLHSPAEWKRAHARLFRDSYDPATTREIRERIRQRFSWLRDRR